MGVHLVGGLIGTLMIGVVADPENAAGYKSIVDGGDFELLGKQAVAAGAVLAYSFVATLVIALLLKVTIGIRVSDEEEAIGIDQVTHAETAYDFGGLGGGGGSLPTSSTSTTKVPS